jgi:hypothetical protein
MTTSIVLFLIPRIIPALRVLHSYLSYLLWMSFLLCALGLGRAFGFIFFLFAIGPVLIIENLFSSSQITPNNTKSHEKASQKKGVIDKGELAGWVHVRICNTDSISELELDEELDESRCGYDRSDRGVDRTHERLQMMMVVNERERGIQKWLDESQEKRIES